MCVCVYIQRPQKPKNLDEFVQAGRVMLPQLLPVTGLPVPVTIHLLLFVHAAKRAGEGLHAPKQPLIFAGKIGLPHRELGHAFAQSRGAARHLSAVLLL